MASNKNIKILPDDAPDAVSAPVPVPIHPNETIALTGIPERQLVAQTQVPVIAGSELITFPDGFTMYIKREWYDKYEALRAPIIYRNGLIFKNIIYPLLTGETIRYTKSLNECSELGQLLAEISYYQIKLTPEQIQDVAVNSGLTIAIDNTIAFINERSSACFNKTFKRNMNIFNTQWAKYIDMVAIRYMNDLYKQFTMTFILDILTSPKSYALVILNMRFNNIVFEFLNWLKNSVIEKKTDLFNTHILQILDDLRKKNLIEEKDYFRAKLSGLSMPAEYKKSVNDIMKTSETLKSLMS